MRRPDPGLSVYPQALFHPHLPFPVPVLATPRDVSPLASSPGPGFPTASGMKFIKNFFNRLSPNLGTDEHGDLA